MLQGLWAVCAQKNNHKTHSFSVEGSIAFDTIKQLYAGINPYFSLLFGLLRLLDSVGVKKPLFVFCESTLESESG